METTTSPLDSLAETAESVYMEETKPKVTIVRPGESKESQEMSSAASSAPQTSGSAGPTAASSQAPSPVSSEAPTPEPQPTEPTESRNAVIIRPEEPDQAALVFDPEAADMLKGDHRIYTAAVSSESSRSASSQTSLICPGHIDLRITAKVQSLEEAESLFSIDPAGNTVEEGKRLGWLE